MADTNGPSDADHQHGDKDKAKGGIDAYLAPYYPHENAVAGVYIVSFNDGYDMDKHFAFLGQKFDFTSLNGGYFAEMDDELFNAVRRDPGVEFIENDVAGERD